MNESSCLDLTATQTSCLPTVSIGYLAKNYNRKKISFKYGKGSFLYSTNGKKYLDFVQGIAVNSLGHAHPKLVNAVNQQSKKLWHVSNAFQIPETPINEFCANITKA